MVRLEILIFVKCKLFIDEPDTRFKSMFYCSRSKTAVYLSTRLRVHFKSWFKFSSLTRCKNGPWSFWVFSSITLPIVIIIAVIAWGINMLSITNIAMYVPSYTELTNGMNSVFQLHTFINFQQIFLFALFFSFFFHKIKLR